jgi:hypothetical protein
MDSTKIKAIIVIVLALFFALYLGVASATESTVAIIWIGGIICATTLLMLGRHVWILIPAFVVFEGTINALPGSPAPWILAGPVVMGLYLIRFLSKRKEFIWRWSLLDLAVLMQLICVIQAWARNPSGLMILGGDDGGGKSYLIFIAAIFSYACLSITAPTVGAIKFATITRIFLGLVDGILLLLQGWFPKFAEIGLRSYVSPAFTTTAMQQAVALDESRLIGARYLGYSLLTPTFCMARPLNCLSPFHIVPFVATAGGFLCILLAGFRSGIAYFGVLFVLASIIRKKPLDAVIFCGVGALALSLVAASGQIDKMPFGVQRALTAFGVEVKSNRVVSSAEDSTNDRFEVWKIVITQPGYINNKLLGDGFSLTKAEHNALVEYHMGLRSFSFIDRCLTTGNYHGFHVATIRNTGILGLLMAIFLMGVVFSQALKLIRYYRNTQLFPYVLYICLPLMLYLPWSLFVYSTYNGEFPKFIVMAGMIKLLENLAITEKKTINGSGTESYSKSRGNPHMPAYS